MNDPTLIAGRYEIVRPLGRGGFAQTFLATDRQLDRSVAIKALHPRDVHAWKSSELFDREVATLRGLRHHGVPEVYDSFRAPWEGAETAFLVMEYIEGTSLAQMIVERRPLDTATVMHLFIELLGVLDYLHTRVPPVLHRDVKPANVIVRPDGSPVLVDFGVVRNVFHGPDEMGSTIAGTYGYMPYEQHMGQASPSSDLYALGATFLHLVTGRAPPDFLSDAGRLEVPATLSVGAGMSAVLSKLLAPAPADRYQSARQVRNVLLGATGTSLAPVPTPALPVSSGGPRFAFGPAPRQMDPEMKRLVKRLAHSPWQLMSPKDKPGTKWGITDVVLTAFFSVVTFGMLPAVFHSLARTRRIRFKRFLIEGIPGEARVLDMELEDIAFGAKMTRVRYEFDADGRHFRDADLILPTIATRWDRGTPLQILYIPDSDYDSVIIGAA